MRIHLIAVGGSIMHNLAMALNRSGHEVTGSDDEIYEPSRSRLASEGLLPEKMGWNAERITSDIDIVILGMHARKDNPELQRAMELNLKVMSFPEFVFGASRNKKRVVIAGSHGKTSTTSMVMHALRKYEVDFDYLVGAIIPGFELMVRLSDAPVIVIEGDEYLSSALDRKPKFFHYKPQITAITGVAWDHRNVFPTKENYEQQFDEYLRTIPDAALVLMYEGDATLERLARSQQDRLNVVFYDNLTYDSSGVLHNGEHFPMSVFGKHNFENMQAAMLICRELGIDSVDFLRAMQDFGGADMRLQQVETRNAETIVFRDFAHAPSKVRSTVHAVREQIPGKTLTAFLELHTFSSLSKDFITEYRGTLDAADRGIIFYSPHTVTMKKLEPLSKEDVFNAFGGGVEVCSSVEELEDAFSSSATGVHLWMSSGRFGGLNIPSLYV